MKASVEYDGVETETKIFVVDWLFSRLNEWIQFNYKFVSLSLLHDVTLFSALSQLLLSVGNSVRDIPPPRSTLLICVSYEVLPPLFGEGE